jgi:phage gp29-like protein
MIHGLQNICQNWRQLRFNPLRGMTPSSLAAAMDSAAAGWLRPAALLYEAIEAREAIVKSVMAKRRAAVARRDWQIITPDPTDPRGESHKSTLEYFYNNLTVTDATDLNVRSGMSGLLRQMMDAIIQKYAVHEIVWQPTPAGLTANLRRVPIYFFENRTGKLRFIGTDSRDDGSPLADDGWMITSAEGIGEAIAICYMFKRLAIQDWLSFSETFSIPGVLGRTAAKKGSDEGNAMHDSVRAFASDWVGLVYGDDGAIQDPIQVIQTPSDGNVPQEPLCAYMDRMIAALVRGGDLSTLSQSNSQGASVQTDETAVLIEDDCALVSETLQTQLDSLIIRRVHGDENPAAYVVINPPSTKDLARDLAIDAGLAKMGVKQDPADLAERYGRSMTKPTK